MKIKINKIDDGADAGSSIKEQIHNYRIYKRGRKASSNALVPLTEKLINKKEE